MQHLEPKAELWRDRAKEARAQAEQMPESIAQVMLLTIAESYERLALWEKKRMPTRRPSIEPRV